MPGIVIIPAFNEAQNLARVIAALRAVLSDDQLLFIDDGSSDDTARVLQEQGVNWLQHPINMGYKETMLTGMQWALRQKSDFVAFFDADGQHHTADLMNLIGTYQAGNCDVVLGSRYKEKDTPRNARGMGTRLFAVIASRFSGIEVTDPTCGLKLIGRKWIQAVVDLPSEDLHAELIVGLARRGARFVELSIQVSPRVAGTSMYHLSKAVLYPARTFLCLVAGYIATVKPMES